LFVPRFLVKQNPKMLADFGEETSWGGMINSAMQGEELPNPKTNDSLTLYGVFCATGPFVGMDFFGRQAC
jgi:hypothetical protein